MENDNTKLTYDEAISIVKAIVGFNSGKLEFVPNYLKYANELPLIVERKEDVLTLRIGIKK